MKRIAIAIATMIYALYPNGTRADLKAYFAKPEPAYKWEKKGDQNVNGVRILDLHLVSQVWQGITWEHRLMVFVPDKAEHPEFCALYNTGGSGGSGDTMLGAGLAKSTGCTCAVLFNIPNQPLYDGKTEDALVVHTWLKYMETGDESWPLHFPMAKAVLKAMDAVQAATKQEGLKEVNGFLIYGGSKRGWTTWLAGASQDKRIKAIAPMVIDTLNLPAQGPHQLEAYGGFSEQIDDYSKVDIFSKLKTKEGQRLIELEDPYSYRKILGLPKLLILGTNDRYWTQDALNLYWDGLIGLKWVLYTPNSGHGLEDRGRVLATLSAFIRTIAGHKPWPQPKWTYRPDGGGLKLEVTSDVPAKAIRLFSTTSKTKDFRDSKWAFVPGQGENATHFELQIDPPESGFKVAFAELVYEVDGRPFTLSTQLRILGTAK
jgi:PhoPQ-activated pathogenicity-related protein